MKRLKFFLPALTLVVVFAISFAGRPAHNNAKATLSGRLFEFIGTPGTTDETDPTFYQDVTGFFDPTGTTNDCPGANNHILCAIETPLIYTAPSPFAGLPKVDQNPLAAEIAAAISANADDVTGTNFVYIKQ